jgi:methylated-DNA-[protein]-cysteine S-methyltransferase
MEPIMMYVEYFNSPIGMIEISATTAAVSSVYFVESKDKTSTANDITTACKQQLNEYFTGSRQVFDLTLAQSGTDFQLKVWQALLKIPFGQLASYRDIANEVASPKAVRAVGSANGKNPISIIVPCHRVIGSNGTLTGYAGGIERKQWLLQHEGQRMFS